MKGDAVVIMMADESAPDAQFQMRMLDGRGNPSH
jgi:hypothetical protein